MGWLLAAVSAVAMATLGIFGRYGYDHGLNVVTILFWRFALAAPIMWGLWLLNRPHGPLPRRREILTLAAMGGIGYVGQAAAYLTSVSYISPGLTAALLYTYPALVSLAVAALGWERFTPLRAGSILLSGAGTLLVAGLAGGSLMPVRGPAWWPLAGMALISTVCAVLAFFAAMARIGPALTAIASTLEPPATAVMSLLLFGEGMGPRQWGGTALVLLGVVALNLGTHSRAHAAVSRSAN